MAESDLFMGRDSDEQQEALHAARPWVADPRCFSKVRISALALSKMVTHADSGGDIEVMGLMQGKVRGDTLVILDAFRLPVEGTETRVNAGAAANEFMISFVETSERMLSDDLVLGWYHSHPGYGCWLSGIDVSTQALYQQHQEPFVAVVIDPKRTNAQGKVEIGAFRTLGAGRPSVASQSSKSNIPLEKMEDFGAHANEYYSLQVEYFRTENDQLLLSQFSQSSWKDTFTSDPLLTNADYFTNEVKAITKKIQNIDKQAVVGAPGEIVGNKAGSSVQLHACTQHACSLAHEALHNIAIQMVKSTLFKKDLADMDVSI